MNKSTSSYTCWQTLKLLRKIVITLSYFSVVLHSSFPVVFLPLNATSYLVLLWEYLDFEFFNIQCPVFRKSTSMSVFCVCSFFKLPGGRWIVCSNGVPCWGITYWCCNRNLHGWSTDCCRMQRGEFAPIDKLWVAGDEKRESFSTQVNFSVWDTISVHILCKFSPYHFILYEHFSALYVR